MNESVKPKEEKAIIKSEIINVGNNISHGTLDDLVKIIEKSYESFP